MGEAADDYLDALERAEHIGDDEMEISRETARQYLAMALEEMKKPDGNLNEARTFATEALRQMRAMDAYESTP